MGLGDGYMIITDPAGVFEADTLQCVHCNCHYVVRPGSGKRRGWCTLCAGTTCGAAPCISCTPFEKRLDAFERRERLMNSLRS